MDINEKIVYSQIKALVELTNQSSIEQLVEVFVFNIKVIFPSKSILLITSHGPKTLNRLAFTTNNLYGTVDRLLQRIGSLDLGNLPSHVTGPHTIVNQDEKSRWAQIPINTKIGTIGFLQIAGIPLEKNIFQAEAQIQTFINQVILLSLNERDALTRLYNREAFHEKLSSLIKSNSHKRKSDKHRKYVLAMLRLDKADEELDPLSRDNILILTARLIKNTFREYDWAFRYNTSVFAIVLHECDLTLAALALGRLNNRIDKFEFPVLGSSGCNIGYTQLDNDHETHEFIEQALQALQQVRREGGGRILSYRDIDKKTQT